MDYTVTAGNVVGKVQYNILLSDYWTDGRETKDKKLSIQFGHGETAAEQRTAIKAYVIEWMNDHPRDGQSKHPPLRSVEGAFST